MSDSKVTNIAIVDRIQKGKGAKQTFGILAAYGDEKI